ncbi:unnamed protein product [Adineta ricciae]|nr:unnamed protein product [Adineta ricciae]
MFMNKQNRTRCYHLVQCIPTNSTRCIKLFYSLIICTIILYLFYDKSSSNLFKTLTKPLLSLSILTNNTRNIGSEIFEEWIRSAATNENSTHLDIRRLSYPYYPRFPILSYTQDITKLDSASKLILLGNGFFENPSWDLISKERSSMETLWCPYLTKYCSITDDKSFFSDADAVVYHGRDPIDLKEANKYRQSHQRFVFALWESPAHTDSLKPYNAFFNWTMTYRLSSDIVASYYANTYFHSSSDYHQLLVRENATKDLHLTFDTADHQPSDAVLQAKKLGTVVALISNQGGSSRRLTFIKHLKNYIDVTVYGKHTIPCPKKGDCVKFLAQNYYFYLSFENSLCQDYTTEKFFGILRHPIVPVVRGFSNYSTFIPPSGFIDVNDFPDVISLARYLNETRDNREKYLSYFSWKQDYVWNQGSLFTSFCDLCIRLHLDHKPKVIEDIHSWWHDNMCRIPQRITLPKKSPK